MKKILNRLKNRFLTKLLVWFPALKEKAVQNVQSIAFDTIPWKKVEKPLSESRLALITTAGVHLKTQEPFDMVDSSGDPSFREIPSDSGIEDLMITHDYFDHKDADTDINIVYPSERLRELVEEGKIGSLSSSFYGFMGHITDHHVTTLLEETGPDVARRLKKDEVDVAFVAPG